MISLDKKKKKLIIGLQEHPKFNSGELAKTNSVVEYDILIWNGDSEILVKKKGKVNRKNLRKSLTFDVPDISYQNLFFSLDVSLVTDGKRVPFITVSEDNPLLADFIKTSDINSQDPVIFTSFNLPESGDVFNVDLYTIEQEQFDNAYLKIAGVKTIVVSQELSELEASILEAERAVRKLNSLKKESLGANVVLEDEIALLNALRKSGVYETVIKLVSLYENSGLLEISEYRQRLYTNLKPVAENLTIAKGRLEKITLGLDLVK